MSKSVSTRIHQRPNIILITTHDTGRHFGCYGVPTVQSPAIDQLASEGVRLSQCFCAAPKCSPSRAAMMTGRWPQSNGVMGLVHSPHDWDFHPGERHLSHILRDADYATHLFHFQHETENLDWFGFDQRHTLPDEHKPDELPDPYGHHPGDEVAKSFESFCQHRTDTQQPFYAQIGFFETHDPLDFGGNTGDDERGITIPEGYVDNPVMRHRMKMMQGSIKQVDSAIDTIMQTLQDHNLEENSIVVFAADHGLPLKRAKDTLYDRGLEIAMIVRWPAGQISDGRVMDQMVSNIDLFPTLLELAQISTPSNVQGRSFVQALRGDGNQVRDELFGCYHENLHTRCIRTPQYKLIRNFSGVRQHPVPVDLTFSPTRTTPFVELYNLNADPLESCNIADDPDYAQIRKTLEKRLMVHLQQVNDPIVKGPVPMPYYSKAIADFQQAVQSDQ